MFRLIIILNIVAFAAFSFGCANTTSMKKNSEVKVVNKKEKVMVENKIESNEENIENNVSDISIKCDFEKSESSITVKYDVKNNSSTDIYLLDIYQEFDPSQDKMSADVESYYLGYKGDNSALILRGIPPLPKDKTVTRRIIPLGSKLASKQKVSKTLEIKLPLKEENKWYYSDFEIKEAEEKEEDKEKKIIEETEDYEMIKINKIIFRAQFIRSNVDGFKAEPAKFTSEGEWVFSSNIAGQAENLQCSHNVDSLSLFKRKDLFSRL